MSTKQIDLAIFYADGSIIECSNEDQIEVTFTFKVSKQYLEAPAHGVQAIVQRDPFVSRHVLRGQDNYYALPKGLIHAADDLSPYLIQHLPGLIKFGVCLDTEEYASVMTKVRNYTTIPRDAKREVPLDAEI